MITKDYYETYWTEAGHNPTGALSPDVRRIFEQQVKPQHACLDVGCGDGRTAGLWLDGHAASYAGVDISSHAVEMACAAGLEATCIEDAVSLPFADNSFDVVTCLEVMEHHFEPHAVAKEIARVLVPGGVFIATVPNVSHWKARVDIAVRGRFDPRGDELSVAEPWRDPHVRFFTPSSLANMLRANGFDSVDVTGRQTSIVRNFRGLSRFALEEPRPAWRWLTDRFPDLGAGLCAVAVTPRAE